MSEPDPNACRAEFDPASSRRGARIIRCHLPAGHPGAHEEDGTGVVWTDPPMSGEQIDRSSVQAPNPPYAEADVHLVVHALTWNYSGCEHDGKRYTECDEHRARAGLAALAAAGRLLPSNARTETVYGARLTWIDGSVDVLKRGSRESAEVVYDSHVRHKRETPGWRVTPELVQRTETVAVGPWVPVSPPTEEER